MRHCRKRYVWLSLSVRAYIVCALRKCALPDRSKHFNNSQIPSQTNIHLTVRITKEENETQYVRALSLAKVAAINHTSYTHYL